MPVCRDVSCASSICSNFFRPNNAFFLSFRVYFRPPLAHCAPPPRVPGCRRARHGSAAARQGVGGARAPTLCVGRRDAGASGDDTRRRRRRRKVGRPRRSRPPSGGRSGAVGCRCRVCAWWWRGKKGGAGAAARAATHRAVLDGAAAAKKEEWGNSNSSTTNSSSSSSSSRGPGRDAVRVGGSGSGGAAAAK